MRVLHLQRELNLSCGVTRTISHIIKNSSAEFEHHLVALGGDGLQRFHDLKVTPTIIKQSRYSVLGTSILFFFLLNYCKKHSIQVIHSHHRYFDTLAWILKALTVVKTITSVQSKVYGKKRFSYKADKLIACSNTIKRHLIKNFNIDENKIIVIFNTVDPTSKNINIDKQQLKIQFGISPDDFIIGFVGRINYSEKGIDVLLEAFNQLSKSDLRLCLLIVGDGPNQKELENYCSVNKLKILFISSKENIFDFYHLMDLVVLPSRIEPFGIIVIEAGLMQKPFIGSNVDGITELVDHEKDGLLFESGNVDDLKTNMEKIIYDKNLADTLAKNLNKKVTESYTVNKIIPEYEKLYLDVFSKN
ncbi:MAG: glycosyltransferase family 4 protein [Ignavibacteria bacterium]|jgi:glycosyltransferase involved in cell wall biosynthesis